MSKEASQSSQPVASNPPRAPRTKSIPKKLQRGIDTRIPGVGITIPEEQAPNPKKRNLPPKDPAQGSASKRKKTSAKKKVAGTKRRSKNPSTSIISSSTDEETFSASDQEGEQEQVPLFVENAIEEIKLHLDPPPGFKTAPVPLPPGLNAKFKQEYSTRGFCAVFSVNLEQLYQECNVNLTPWFGPYQSFVSIEAPYHPELVKMFYFNMQSDHIVDSEGVAIEERITTCVRGVQFTISAAILNRILKTVNPPEASTPRYSNEEIYRTLMLTQDVPDDQRAHLSFRPADMPPLHRVIWHIYSRNFVQKGGSYTHFTLKDYRFFTAFINKHPLNIGQWLFKEISYFKFVSRKNSYMPFASLVSVIMFYHKIWYVGPPEQMKYISPFGKTVLKMMKVRFDPEGSGQSQAPLRSQTRATQSVAQEAQSTPPSVPSDLDQRIQQMVNAAAASLFVKMQFEFGKLGADLRNGLNEVIAGQEDMKSKLVQLKEQNESKQDELSDQIIDLDAKLSSTWTTACVARDNVDKLISHFNLGATSSTFGFTSAPSSSTSIPAVPPSSPETHYSPPSSPSFAFPSPPHTTSFPASTSTPSTVKLPSPITPSTELLSDPIPSPPTPTTEIFSASSPDSSFDPTTAMVVYTPPLVILDPEYLDDDKGGEGEKDV